MRTSCLALLALVACGDATRDASTPAAATSSAPAAASAAPPSDAPAAAVPCSAGEIDVDGACVHLPEGVSAGALRAPGRHGFWNAWSSMAPLPAAIVEKVREGHGDLGPAGGEKAARATCEKDGFVRGATGDRAKKDRFAAHALVAIASRDVEADLWGSVSGSLEVWIGQAAAARFATVGGDGGRPLPDEAVQRVHIPRGATTILALHERVEERPGGFMLRLRDPSGAPLRGVRFVEAWASARCRDAELLDVHLDAAPAVDPSGGAVAELVLHPSFDGLAPATLGETKLLAVSTAGKDELGRALTAALAPEALLAGTATARVTVPLPKRGDGAIALRVEGSEASALELATKAYPKDLALRIAKLRSMIGAGANATSPATASLEAHVATLSRAAMTPERDVAWLEEHTARAEALAKVFASGEDPYPAARGAVFRAHRSPIDGELQRYVAFVPPSAGKAPLPLVLVAHGMNRGPEHALRTLVGQPPDEHMSLDFAAKHLPRFVDQRAILVAPLQFGDAGPHPLGEQDLLDVIDDVSKTWPVDPARVSLTGYSLGGTVAFVAPLHQPDRFAAAAPLCGYPNLMDYKSVRSVDKTAWEPALLAKEYIVGWAENGLYLPLHVVHGGKDTPERSRLVVDRYKDLQQSVTFDVDEEAEHDVWTHGYEEGRMVSWLTRRSRPEAPRRVRFVTGDLRHDRAYWVRVLALDDYGAKDLARIDATFDPKSARLTMSTRGVAALVIDRTALPDAKGERRDPGEVQVEVDGRDLGASASGAPLVLSRAAPGAPLELRAALPELAGAKRHGVSGPLTDAWRDALVVVRGTAAPELVEANRLVAEHVASAFGTSTLDLPIWTDAEATEQRIGARGVVLVGGPASNRLAKTWEASLPAKLEPGAITVHGQRYEGPDLAVSAIGPRPGAPDHYVVLHAGMTERATLAVRNLPRYLPDWVVYDGRIASERGGLLFGRRPTVAGGFFDASWR